MSSRPQEPSAPPLRPSRPEGLRRVAGNAAALLLASGLPRLFTVTSMVIAARVLGADEFGDYGTAASLAVILGLLVSMGLSPYLVREFVQRPGDAPRLMDAANKLKVGASFLMMGALVLLGHFILRYPSDLLLAAAFLGLAQAIAGYAENLVGHFQAIERMHVWTQASSAVGLVAGVAGIVLIVATENLAWFCAAAALGQAAGLAWLHFRGPGRPSGVRADWEDVRELLFAAAPFAAAFLVMTMYYRLDILILRELRTRPEVGIYTAATKFAEIVTSVILGAVAAAYPPVSRAARRLNGGERWAGTRLVEFVILSAVPASAALWLIRSEAVRLVFSAEYGDAAAVLGLLAISFPALGINLLAGYLLAATDRMRTFLLVYFGGLVLNVVVNLWLVPSLGPTGAATARIVGELAMALAFMWPLGALSAAPRRRAVLATFGAVGLLVPAYLLPDPTGGWMAASVYLSAVALFYWRLEVIPEDERTIIRAAMRRPREKERPPRPPRTPRTG